MSAVKIEPVDAESRNGHNLVHTKDSHVWIGTDVRVRSITAVKLGTAQVARESLCVFELPGSDGT